MALPLTSFLSIIFVSISLTNTEIQFGQDVYFNILPCLGINVEDIMRATTVHESRQRWMLKCAASCNEDKLCDYAIFRPSAQKCSHVSNANFTLSQDSPPADDQSCSILRKTRKLECENGGKPLSHVCDCPSNSTGRECEIPNKEFCQEGTWRNVTSDDYEMLTSSMLQMKFMKHENTAMNMYPISHYAFYSQHNCFIIQSNDLMFVDVPRKDFYKPLKRLYTFYSTIDNTMKSYLADMRGVTSKREQSVSDGLVFDLLIRDSIDTDRLVYQNGVTGYADKLIDDLLKGYRFLTRDPNRVGFDKANDDAYFELVRGNVGARRDNIILPLYYYTYKETTKEMYVSRWEILSGNFTTSNTGIGSAQWEFDRCWVKVDPILEYDGFTNVLKEIILGGRDVRLVIGESVSTDVSMVTVTTNDVIAILADYLTPFDATSPLNETSRIRFPLISRSKILAECEKAFVRSTVYKQNTEKYNGKLDWFASSRPWRKILTMTSGGQVIYGSRLDVYEAVTQGHNVRVCIEQKTGSLWVCCRGTFVTGDKLSKDVMLQTPAVMNVAVHDNGTFAGIEGTDCKFNVMLVSTEGWIKNATYNPGTAFSEGDVVDMTFTAASWFVEY